MEATLREFDIGSDQDGQASRYQSKILFLSRPLTRARNCSPVAFPAQIACKCLQHGVSSHPIFAWGNAMARRKEGSVYQIKDGRFRVAVWVTSPDGSSRRVYRTCRSRAKAEMIKCELLEQQYTLVDKAVAVDEVLDAWMHHAGSTLKPKTVANYKHLRKKHITPRIGTVSLREFTPLRAQQWVQQMISEGVGVVTIQRAKALLQRAFLHACDMQIASSNPLLKVTVPSHDRNEQDPFTQEEVKKICECKHYGILYRLAFQTGMRQGELFGLRRKFVDVDNLQLRVAAQVVEVGGKVIPDVPPKTKQGKRIVPLSKELASDIAEMNLEPEDFVFTAPTSDKPIRYSNFRERCWARRLKSLKIRHRGMHQTRHTAATHMLRNGIEPHVVSKILGHSRPSITLDIYAHVIPEDQDRVRGVMSTM